MDNTFWLYRKIGLCHPIFIIIQNLSYPRNFIKFIINDIRSVSLKRRPHFPLTSLPTSFMKFLVMTALPPYNGQTNRPLIKRIKEHECNSRLYLHNPDDFSHNQSAPAHHSRTTGHKIAWDRTTTLTTTRSEKQLDLTEHTAINTRYPSLHRTDSALHALNSGTPLYPKLLVP